MTPYYADDAVVIYHGDALDVMSGIGAADLAVTSPPYNLGSTVGAYANMGDSYRQSVKSVGGYSRHDDNMDEGDYIRWQKSILSELWRITAPTHGAIFYNHKPVIRNGVALLPTRLVPQEARLRQIIIWDRQIGMNWNASHFVPQHEWIMLLAHPAFRLSDRSASVPGDVWTIPVEKRDWGHPCPFPESLAMKAIAATTANCIVDPFMGSGTTLVAAKGLGRRAIGIEIEERYCEIAARRCSQEVLGLSA
jgi:site-specific DNA-methyltransferase (adenine-specific)